LLRDHQLFPPGSGHAVVTANLEIDTMLLVGGSDKLYETIITEAFTAEIAKNVKRIARDVELTNNTAEDWIDNPYEAAADLMTHLDDSKFDNLESLFFVPFKFENKLHLPRVEEGSRFLRTKGPIIMGRPWVEFAVEECGLTQMTDFGVLDEHKVVRSIGIEFVELEECDSGHQVHSDGSLHDDTA